MKKFLFLFVLNSVIILLLLFIAESFLFFQRYFEVKNFWLEPEVAKTYNVLSHIQAFYGTKNFYSEDEIRETAGKEYLSDAPAIITVGCSFTYGEKLPFEETFGYRLSEYTKRVVFNFGLPARGIKEALWLLNNDEFLKKNKVDKNNTEYVIYTYINDHLRRLYVNIFPLTPHYKIKDGRPVFDSSRKFFEKTYISVAISKLMFYKFYEKDAHETAALYFNEINRTVKENFKYDNGKKSAKFVILKYSTDELKESLLDKDIIVINVADAVGENIYCHDEETSREYCLYDNHPSGEAWKKLVPVLSDILKLK